MQFYLTYFICSIVSLRIRSPFGLAWWSNAIDCFMCIWYRHKKSASLGKHYLWACLWKLFSFLDGTSIWIVWLGKQAFLLSRSGLIHLFKALTEWKAENPNLCSLAHCFSTSASIIYFQTQLGTLPSSCPGLCCANCGFFFFLLSNTVFPEQILAVNI